MASTAPCMAKEVIFPTEGIGTISAVEIEGAHHVDKKIIKDLLKTKEGDVFNKSNLSEDISAIYKLGFFSKVEADITTVDGLKVTFIVIEGPVILNCLFSGNTSIEKDELHSQLLLHSGDIFNEFKLKESTDALITLYQNKGFYMVEITPTVEEKEGGFVLINYKIVEGKKMEIKAIEFSGNKVFSGWRLRWQMESSKGDSYDPEKLAKDIQQIKFFYMKAGYPLIVIEEPKVEYNKKKGGIVITIPLSEGSQFKISGIKIEGNNLFTKDKLMELVKTKPGDIYKIDKFMVDRQAIQQLYGELGYVSVEVIPTPDFDIIARQVAITLQIKEGNQSYIESITISGNTRTKNKVIRRELLLKEGEMFDSKKINRSRQRLNNLGIFDEVTIEILPGSSETQQQLKITVKEGKTNSIMFGAGYGSAGGFFGSLEWASRNLLGRGWSLNVKTEFGEEYTNYDIGFTNPWFLDTPTSVGFNLWDTRINLDDYENEKKGGSIKIGRALGQYNQVLFKYKYEDVAISNVEDSADSAIVDWVDKWGEGEFVTTSSFNTQFVRNTKKGENIFYPTAGYEISVSNEVAGGIFGGDVNFYKPLIDMSWYIPSWWKFVLCLHLRSSLITNLVKDEELPDYEKFYLGGGYSIRGYYERTIHPESGGGASMLISNIEYRFPLMEPLYGALFADAGNSWEESNFGSLSELKYSCGFGIRFNSPVGPIRLDYGWGLTEIPGHDSGDTEFHFSIGPLF